MIAFSRHGRFMNKLIAAVPYGKQLLFEKVLDGHFIHFRRNEQKRNRGEGYRQPAELDMEP